MAKQLSLQSYVKTPNLTRNKDSKTAARESTVCEEKDKSDEEWRISRKEKWRMKCWKQNRSKVKKSS